MVLWLLNDDDHDVCEQLFVHSHFHFEQHCFVCLVLPKFGLSEQKKTVSELTSSTYSYQARPDQRHVVLVVSYHCSYTVADIPGCIVPLNYTVTDIPGCMQPL